MSRTTTAWLILASTVAAGSLAATSSAGGPSSPPDVTALFDRAVTRVRANPEFPNAVMLEANGSPAGNRAVTRASKIVRWRFVFNNQQSHGSSFASATLSYRRSGGFGSVVGHTFPVLEDLPIKESPRMTLEKAVSLLKAAGFRQGFFNVTLRRPLGPQRTPPLYIFGLEGSRFVAVNTKTGKVSPIT